MALDTTLNIDTITIDTAGNLDAAWVNAGMPHDGLHIYGLRRSGNKTVTFLGAPGLNGSAPNYVLSNGRYLHVSGPTVADYQQAQQARQDYQEQRELQAWAGGR